MIARHAVVIVMVSENETRMRKRCQHVIMLMDALHFRFNILIYPSRRMVSTTHFCYVEYIKWNWRNSYSKCNKRLSWQIEEICNWDNEILHRIVVWLCVHKKNRKVTLQYGAICMKRKLNLRREHCKLLFGFRKTMIGGVLYIFEFNSMNFIFKRKADTKNFDLKNLCQWVCVGIFTTL